MITKDDTLDVLPPYTGRSNYLIGKRIRTGENCVVSHNVVAEVADCGGTVEERSAMARQFAALPKMIEALEDCITSDKANCIVTNDVAYMLRRFKAINKIARDALSACG